MSRPDPQSQPDDSLLIGFRADRSEQVRVINLCRQFGGKMIFREREIIVVEATGAAEQLNQLLDHLPWTAVTHLWRSGRTSTFAVPQTNFQWIETAAAQPKSTVP